MGTAALVGGWQRRYNEKFLPATFTGAPAPSENAAPFGPTVEIYYDEAWQDISTYVFYDSKISITRGRPDEASQTNPANCSLVINNRNGYFAPRNPTSPLYGKIGRNTPLRVSRVVNGTCFYRFTGEVVAWPQTWDITGNDIRVPIQAAGIKRRLNQGDSALNSVMYRAITTSVTELDVTQTVYIDPQYQAYWPCEDVSGASSIASGFSGNSAMTISGTPTLATNTSFAASSALPTMGSASFTGTVPTYPATDSILVRFFLAIPSGGATNGQTICTIATNGTVASWKLIYGTGGTLQLQGFDSAGTNVGDSGAVAFSVNGSLIRMSIEITQNGTAVQGRMATLVVGATTGSLSSISVASSTVGRALSVTMAADKGLTDTVIGQVSVQSANTSIFGLATQINAYIGENPSNRYKRLCSEENIAVQSINRTSYTNVVTMGTQSPTKLVDLLQSCVDTDLGIDFEPRDQLGLTYRPRTTFYNQSAALTLDYGNHELSSPLTPVDDDQKTRNDITVTRDGGSSARSVLVEGALSVLDPPNGVGRYDDAQTLSLGSDDQCDDQSGWRLHLGTVDEPRYPSVTVQLGHSTFANDYGMTSQALSLEIGDRIDVINPPTPSPPDNITLLVQGYSETFDQFLHEIEYICTPYSPWNVFFASDAVYGYADTDGSLLAADVDATTTSLSVMTTDGLPWTTSAGDMPFDIKVAGEVMTVSAITAAYYDFEDTINTAGDAGTWSYSTLQANTGTHSLTVTGDGAFPTAAIDPKTHTIGVIPWDMSTVDLQFYVKVTAVDGNDTGPDLGVRVHYLDKTRTEIGTPFIVAADIETGAGTIRPEFTNWYLVSVNVPQKFTSGSATPPTGTAFIWLEAYAKNWIPGNVAYLDTVSPAPQTFTVTRSVNGVSKAQLTSADVRLAHPTILGL
jgi:hypothetical protein